MSVSVPGSLVVAVLMDGEGIAGWGSWTRVIPSPQAVLGMCSVNCSPLPKTEGKQVCMSVLGRRAEEELGLRGSRLPWRVLEGQT